MTSIVTAWISFNTLSFLLAGCENGSLASEEGDDPFDNDNQQVEPDDGKQLINNWNNHSAREDSGIIYLQAGQSYSIKLEYYEHHFDAVCKLLWESGAVPKQIIPRSNMLPVPWM